MWRLSAACALSIALMTQPLSAADISVGLSAEVTSIDPHFHNLTPNNNVAAHLFDALVGRDARGRLVPALAESWRALDDRTWEFRLRKGVKFHDGTDFTATDVAFSIDRLPNVPNSPSPFTTYSRQITEKIVVDAHTIRFRTARPYPLMPTDLSTIRIVSSRAAKGASTEDFNSGKAAIGTGPFRFVRWQKGDRVELARNPDYWGPKTMWDKAVLRMLTSDPTRVAALLAGEVRAIENVPPADLSRLARHNDLSVYRIVSHRVMYMHLDSARERSPYVTDKAGKPLERNPLRDVRVRRALSKAIDRQALVDRVMEGAARPTGPLLPEGMFGYAPGLRPEAHDPAGARKLLAEAGYPDGFGLTLHAPNNRYVNDEQVAQAIAQMLTRAGIATRVETMPSSVFFSRANKLEFSVLLAGWGSETAEASSPLKSLVATYDKEKGMGQANRGRYSSRRMDELLEQALAAVDDSKRESLLQQATEVAMKEVGIITLYHQENVWAARRGVAYTPRADERTYAHEFRIP